MSTFNVTLDPVFLEEVKGLLLTDVDASEPPGGLRLDEPLFGPDSRLDLDSLDGLQLSVAIQKRYGIRMADSKDLRRALTSLTALANYISTHRK
jgi:acyl carrier protein